MLVVPRIVCKQTRIVVGGPTGGNQAEEASAQMSKARGTDDGFGHSHGIGI